MSEILVKPKRKYIRKTAKNIDKDIETIIEDKIKKGKTPSEKEIHNYLESLGFENGNIPEPEELPLPKKRCPKGTRKDKNGNCIPVAPIPEPEPVAPIPEPAPAAVPKKRCPKGTRRNKNGDCIPIAPIPEPEPEPEPAPSVAHKKRCPKGTRRNKNGDCVPIVQKPQPEPELPQEEPELPQEEPELPQEEPELPQPEPELPQEEPELPQEEPEPELSELQQELEQEKEGDKSEEIPAEELQQAEQEEEPKEESINLKEPMKDKMNAFLVEKERLERENSLKGHDYLYPDLNDPNFNIKIALKKEFHDFRYDGEIRDIETQANLLCKAKFELSPHQVFVKNFLSENTPYKSLLLYHGLGTGKTCSAIGVAEEMRRYMKRTGLNRQIFVIASPNVQGNFKQQLFDERKLTKVTNEANPNEFTWNIESCVGNSLLSEINPNSIRNLTREKLISNINSLINEHYMFMGYIQFANIAKIHMIHGEKQEEINIRKFFDNRLIIIDEVHNIRLADESNSKEMQQVGSILMKVINYAKGLRLLLLSATPMFNSYKEIVWITNLLNANDGRSQIQASDIFESDGSFKESGEDILRRKLIGYVSYVRGENPYTFPYRLYPVVFSPENSLQSFVYPRIQMNGQEIDTPIKNINVYVNRVERTTYQMRVYLSIIDYMRIKTYSYFTKTGTYREMPNFDNMESFGYALLQRPLEALNIVYPNENITQMLSSDSNKASHYSDELFQNAVGGTGLANIMTFDSMEEDEPLKHNYEYKPDVLKKYGRIFSQNELSKYSSKMSEICNAIKNSEGIVLIYSQYIDGGVVPMALALEEMGFSRYCHSYAGRHRHLFKHAPTPPIDSLTMQPMVSGGEPAQYIVITGDKGLSPSNTEDVKYATNPNNIYGQKVKVIIISRAGSEGLDFKVIRQIHILEPWFNMNRIEQIIGRGVRNLSHCLLPFKKRNVQIYLHSTLIIDAEEEPADLYLYRLAEKKALQIGRVTRVLKENAADCILHIGQSNFTMEKLSSLVANQNIMLELSTKNENGDIREVNFRIGDLSGSEICDYMSCEYQCRPKMPAKWKEERSSFMENNLNSNINHIIGRIKELFRERHVYTLEQISRAINVVNIYPIEQIYYGLSQFVDNRNMVLLDKYGRFGYLLNRNKYYEFQPIEITDTRSSVHDRSVPVEYKRGNIILELNERITEPATSMKMPGSTIKPNAVKHASLSTFEPGVYRDIVIQIREMLNIVKMPHSIKSTEMDWYKNASRALEHLHIVHGFKEDEIIKYVIYHYLDSSNYQVKRTIFENVIDTNIFDIDPEIETNLSSYFRQFIMQSDKGDSRGIYITNREEVQLILKDKDEDSWKEGDKFDVSDYKIASAKYTIDTKKLNDIVGYMIQFKDQDMSFYYKDIHLKRNRKGRRCDRSGGKAPIIDMLNRITSENMYSEENTSSVMYSGSLCVVLEMLLRKYNETSQNIFYLTPEQAILNKITDYSTNL